MAKGPSYIYLIPHLLKTLLGKASTVTFPFGPLELPQAYRGRVAIDIDACKGCGLCARDCPANALFVQQLEDRGVRIVLYSDRCTTCGQCELSCRYNVISLQPSFEPGAPSRSTLKAEWVKNSSDA